VTTQRIKSWLRRNVTGLFGVLSVFGRRIKWMIRLRPEQVWTCNVTLHVYTCSAGALGQAVAQSVEALR